MCGKCSHDERIKFMNTQLNMFVLVMLVLSLFVGGCAMPVVAAAPAVQSEMVDTCVGTNADGSLFMEIFDLGPRPPGEFVECYDSDPKNPRYILFQRSKNVSPGVSPVGDASLEEVNQLINDGTASQAR